MYRTPASTFRSSALAAAALGLAACGVRYGQPSGTPAGSGMNFSVAKVSSVPNLPATLYAYSDATAPLPQQFLVGGPGVPPGPPPFGRGGRGGRGQQPPPPPPPGRGPGGRGGRGGPGVPVIATDASSPLNPVTDAGATLGRVLFYDVRLSANNRIACASCHQQEHGFGDTTRFSVGLHGKQTARHAMALANARFYQNGRYFSDERAPSLEAQVLQPIQNETEMGMSLDSLVPKLRDTKYYPALFQAAFGSPDVTTPRISLALAQFVRSLVSGQSKFDEAFAFQGPPNFGVLTPLEQEGQRLFAGRGQCQTCHGTNAQILDTPHNTGLDAQITDVGAGAGRFKSSSLRNVAVRAPYMHDGRFANLGEVVDFYDHGVKDNPDLDPRLRGPNGEPRRLNLTVQERAALIAYLESLTDRNFLKAEKFSNPFAP